MKFIILYLITIFNVGIAILEKSITGKDDGIFWIFIGLSIFQLVCALGAYVEEKTDAEIKKPPNDDDENPFY